MPLGVRDVLLIIRAQDLASREIGRIGAALGSLGAAGGLTGQNMLGIGAGLTTIGAGIAGIGAAGLAFFGNATNAAKEYRTEVALTLTQVDQVGVKLEDIAEIGRRVAKEIPAPFKEMQSSLFDIFSSMDVNTTQAESILKNFAKAAVAGQTDVQTAGRASIAIMNGFGINADQIGRVMDVQFEAVRKGVFTYEEFASTIGRAIPSANRAGASVEDLAGMMAFLTRNGMSSAMAATSSARAFDLMTNPKFRDKMEALGLAVVDANGNFRPMVDIVTDLRGAFEKMNEGDRAKALKDLTLGSGGVIQAMRFMDLAIKDSDGSLNALTGNMNDASGAMGTAYAIMADTPEARIQLLANRWAVLKTQIGDVLLPTLNKLVDVGMKIMDFLEGIDPKLLENIVLWGAIASVAAVVVGGLLILVGVLAMVTGALMLMGLSLGAAAAVVIGIPLAIAALIAIFVLLIMNIESVRSATDGAFTFMQELVARAMDGIRNKVQEVWMNIKDTFFTFLIIIQDFYNMVLGDILAWWDKEGPKLIAKVAEIWQIIYTNTKEIWDMVGGAVSNVLMILMGIIGGFVAFVGYLWKEFGDNLLRIVSAVWNMITEVIRGALNVIFGIVKFVLAVLNGDWRAAWEAIKQTVDGAWDAIFGILRGAVVIVGNIIGTIVEAILSPLGNLGGALYNLGRDIIQGLVNGFGSMMDKVKEKIGDVVRAVTNPLQTAFKFGSPSKVTTQWGKWLGEGLANGIVDSSSLVEDASRYLAEQFNKPSVGLDATGTGFGAGAIAGLAANSTSTATTFAPSIVIQDARDPERTAALVDERLRALYQELIAQN